MDAICDECGKQYSKMRETSKFCSNNCRSKAHKREKRVKIAATLSASATVEAAWIPSQRESVLNNVVAELDLSLFKIKCILNKLDDSPLVREIVAIATQATSAAFHDEVRQEVNSFDLIERLYKPDSFEARTGITLSNKRTPL